MMAPSASAGSLSDRVRYALTQGDLEAFGALLREDVQWGDEHHPRGCRNRAEVLATFARALSAGLKGAELEIESGTKGIFCELSVAWPANHPRSDDVNVFHVYLVKDGEIFQILRFFDRNSAALAAGLS
jgi:ketosteroid isomerase-like protein